MQAKEMLENILYSLKNTKGIEASAAVSKDGLLIYSTLSNKHAETFTAMLATMFGAAEIAALELGKGNLRRVIVESKQGKIIATGAKSKVLLLVMTSPDANLGMVLLETAKALDRIIEVLQEPC